MAVGAAKRGQMGSEWSKGAFLWPKGGGHLVLPRKNAYQYKLKNAGSNAKHKKF